jgi:hypothetical protein
MDDTAANYFVQSRNIHVWPPFHKGTQHCQLQHQMDRDIQLLLNASEIPYIYWVGSWVNLKGSLDVVAKRNVPVHVRN